LTLVTRATAGAVDTLWSKPGLTLSGIVIDSALGTPIADARVDLLGLNVSGLTDARGRFQIRNVLAGTYRAEVVTPELATIGTATQSTIAFADSNASYQIRVPTPSQLMASICPGRALARSQSAVVGQIHQSGDSVGVSGARVMAQWTEIALRDERGIAVERTGKRIEGQSGADGKYRLCGVPASTNIVVTASTPAGFSGTRQVYATSSIVRLDLALDHDLVSLAAFAGRVLIDSTTMPVEGAEIYFPELSKVGRSAANGEFRIPEIPAGEQRVIVRRLGFAALDAKLTFAPNATLDRTVFLSRVHTLDSVVVVDHASERAMRDFNDNKRLGLGHFMDRDELAKLSQGAKLDRIVSQWPGIALAFGSGGRTWITGTHASPLPCMAATATCAESHGYYFPDRTEAAIGVKVACYPQVYVDDVLMNRGYPTRPFELTSMFADQVEAIEWYSGPSQTPSRYSNLGAICGVLVIHTRRTP
jgi:hypothetical protein